MKKLIIAAALSLGLGTAIAQTWNQNPVYSDIVKSIGDPNQKYVCVLDERSFTFGYGSDNSLSEERYLHFQYYVNSPEAIDALNKIYLPSSSTQEVMDFNARVISKDGKVRVLSKDDLKEGTNEDGQQVKYFAVSGVELGAIVEYYYKIKTAPDVAGRHVAFERSVPTILAKVKIQSPANLIFKTLSLNDFPKLQKDTTLKYANVLEASMSNVPGVKEEKFCNADVFAKGVIFQLDENTSNNNKNIYNYGTVSQLVYSSLNFELPKSVSKKLDKVLKASDYASGKTDREKIFKIEDYVKQQFTYVDERFEGMDDFNFILEKKILSKETAVRLLFKLYKQAGIEFEIVLTTDRAKLRFDKNFESYIFLDDYLFYFPSVDNYVCPSARFFRLGIIPPGNLANLGLFIRPVTLGGVENGAGEVREIKAFPAKHTGNQMNIEVNFTEGMEKADIKNTVEYSGYYATRYQPAYTYVEPDKIKDLNNDVVENIYKDAEAEEIKVENEGVDKLGVVPFKVSFRIQSPAFIEKAGKKVLFKVGDLIGPQAEMYQEGERQYPVENDFNRIYTRKMTINIPEGYVCKNPEVLALNVVPFKSKKNEAGFESNYKVNGNKIEVEISEYYNEIFLPKPDYEDYRKVINAAADFNKLVLVIEKL